MLDSEHKIQIEIVGKNLELLTNEAGGLRLQRIPPTEKRNRIHTSTVTIAIIDPNIKMNHLYNLKDDCYFEVEWFSGTGKGGQKRNKSQTSCRVRHKPTGIVETRQGRSRSNNFNDAKQSLINQLDNLSSEEIHDIQSTLRKKQVGSGMRGDKIRTIRFQDDQVVDHRTGKTITAKKFMKGNMDLLW